MMLAIDIGNSETTIGYFEGKELVHHWRVQTRTGATADEWQATFYTLFNLAQLHQEHRNRVVIASVVPSLNQPMQQIFAKSQCTFVDHHLQYSFEIALPNPAQIGADRLANVEATLQLYSKPAIIVDAGTATTFCVLNSKAQYLGGAIAPGMLVATEALLGKAARLNHVDLQPSKRLIGNTTEDALKSGVVHGHAAMIDTLVERIQEESAEANPCTLLTGGCTNLLRPYLRKIQHFDPWLTLKGLQLISERNR